MLLLNALADYASRLEPVPEGATLHRQPSSTYDFVQLFVSSKAELTEHLAMTTLGLKGVAQVAIDETWMKPGRRCGFAP